MPHTSSTRLKSLSLRLSSQSRTSGSSSKSYGCRILPLTLGQITGQAAGAIPIATVSRAAPRTQSVRSERTSGHARPPQATLRECLLSSRSRVRVAVGAQLSVRTYAPFLSLGSQTGSQTTELQSLWHVRNRPIPPRGRPHYARSWHQLTTYRAALPPDAGADSVAPVILGDWRRR